MEDQEILQLFFKEDRKHYAFNMLVRTHSEKLYWPIRRIVMVHDDADDVLQNTFIKAWKGLPKFKGNSSLYSWLYRIATNEALTFIRKNKRFQSQEINEQLDYLRDDPYFDGDEAYLQFMAVVENLPEKQKLVFKMKYFDELTYKEISEIVGGTEGSLKASYFHASKKIAENIKKELNLLN